MGHSNSKNTVLFNHLFGYKIDATEITCNDNPYTQQELDIAQKQKQLLLKSTIIICAFFALISLILLIISFVSIDFKYILFNELMPFMVTFVIGAIFIILYLAIKVYRFKPYRKCETTNDNSIDDNINCPDYWILSPNGNDVRNPYKCNVNPNIVSKENTFKFDTNMKITNNPAHMPIDKGPAWDSNSINFSSQLPNHLYKDLNDSHVNSSLHLTPRDLSTFQDSAMIMANYNAPDATGIYSPISTNPSISPVINNLTGTAKTLQKSNGSNTGTEVPLLCDQVIPSVLATADTNYAVLNPGVTNKFRCAYAKACGVTWSDANCE